MEGIKKTYNKLVRDNMPQFLEAKGVSSVTRIVEGKERTELLVQKLQEEIAEFVEARNEEELADVLEVLDALIIDNGFSKENIERIRKEKRAERGGFERGIVLEETEE